MILLCLTAVDRKKYSSVSGLRVYVYGVGLNQFIIIQMYF